MFCHSNISGYENIAYPFLKISLHKMKPTLLLASSVYFSGLTCSDGATSRPRYDIRSRLHRHALLVIQSI